MKTTDEHDEGHGPKTKGPKTRKKRIKCRFCTLPVPTLVLRPCGQTGNKLELIFVHCSFSYFCLGPGT